MIGARFLGPAGWGAYWSAFSAAQILSATADLGGHLTLARDVARTPGATGRVLGVSLRFKIALTALAGGLFLASGGVPSLPVALQYPLAASLFCLSFTEWTGYYLRGRGLVVAESLVLSTDCLLAFVLGAWTLSRGAGPAGLAISQLVAHAAAFGLALAAARKLAPVSLAPSKPGDAKSFVRTALPTGAAILASIASWRLGTLGLLWLSPAGTTDVVGLYSAAHRVLEGARFLPVAFAAAFFPGFARPGRSAGPFRLVFVMTATAALASLALVFRPVAGAAVRVLLGTGFDAAPEILSVVFLAFPFLSANSVISQYLVARGREKTNAAVSLVHLACHAAALWLLVPRLGAMGAATALVVAEGVACAAGFLALLTPCPAEPGLRQLRWRPRR